MADTNKTNRLAILIKVSALEPKLFAKHKAMSRAFMLSETGLAEEANENALAYAELLNEYRVLKQELEQALQETPFKGGSLPGDRREWGKWFEDLYKGLETDEQESEAIASQS